MLRYIFVHMVCFHWPSQMYVCSNMIHNSPSAVMFSSLARILMQQLAGLSSFSTGDIDSSSSFTICTRCSNPTKVTTKFVNTATYIYVVSSIHLKL